jgi:Icc-related predicted phosphoesterase
MLLESNARFRKWFGEVESKAAWLPIVVVHGDLVVNAMLSRQVQSALRRVQQEEQAKEAEEAPVTDMPLWA